MFHNKKKLKLKYENQRMEWIFLIANLHLICFYTNMIQTSVTLMKQSRIKKSDC